MAEQVIRVWKLTITERVKLLSHRWKAKEYKKKWSENHGES